jgi:predicted GTPase
MVVVADPLRPGDELRYHPGEANLRLADAVVINKVDSATPEQVRVVEEHVGDLNPGAAVLRAASPVTLADGPSIEGRRVLVVEDGPTITHGQMPFGAGTVAAEQGGAATQVDPRPHAVGSIAETFERFPHIGAVLPAMGYSADQLAELERTINAVDCDVVVAGTPIDLARLISCRHPIRQTDYELRELEGPKLSDLVAPLIERTQAGDG